MSLNVIALARGGLSVYGQGRYDSRASAVICNVLEDEVLDVSIRFQGDVDEFDYSERGIDASEPTISDNTISVQFQTISAGGWYEIVAMFESGAAQRVRFLANPFQITCAEATLTPSDDDDVDYGAWG